MCHALDDFEQLSNSIGDHPTRLGEIIPDTPVCIGAHDAAGQGAGGVWFTPDRNLVWRACFPPDIIARLVSSDNPTGNITNSDLEQAGGVWHHMVLANQRDIRERTVQSACDNTPAVSRFRKGSVGRNRSAPHARLEMRMARQ